MEPNEQSPEPDLFPEPVTGTFHTSWRAALAMTARIVAGLAVVFGVLGWMSRDLLMFWIMLGMGGVWLIMDAVLYRIWGVESVEITPEALLVSRPNRRPVRIAWADIRDAHYRSSQGGDAWVFRHGHERTVVPERGFSTDDWWNVRLGINAWKASGPLATLPGVEMGGSRSHEPIFVPHHPSILFWGIPLFLLVGLLPIFLEGIGSYRNGSWADEPGVFLGIPAFGFGMALLMIWALLRTARRIVFQPHNLRVERFIRGPLDIPYSEITDAWHNVMKTRQGTITLGDRNTDSFERLLAERLTEDQLSGKLGMVALATYSSPLLLLGLVIIPAIISFGISWTFGLSRDAGSGVLVAMYAFAGAIHTLWVRRRARRWLEEAEREA